MVGRTVHVYEVVDNMLKTTSVMAVCFVGDWLLAAAPSADECWAVRRVAKIEAKGCVLNGSTTSAGSRRLRASTSVFRECPQRHVTKTRHQRPEGGQRWRASMHAVVALNTFSICSKSSLGARLHAQSWVGLIGQCNIVLSIYALAWLRSCPRSNTRRRPFTIFWDAIGRCLSSNSRACLLRQ
jgi:hypothetical protein